MKKRGKDMMNMRGGGMAMTKSMRGGGMAKKGKKNTMKNSNKKKTSKGHWTKPQWPSLSKI